MYALPFILGLIGLFFQYNRNRRDFIINMLLFFFHRYGHCDLPEPGRPTAP
jgi:hypothetical protein